MIRLRSGSLQVLVKSPSSPNLDFFTGGSMCDRELEEKREENLFLRRSFIFCV